MASLSVSNSKSKKRAFITFDPFENVLQLKRGRWRFATRSANQPAQVRNAVPRVNNGADSRVQPQPRPKNPPANHPIEVFNELLVVRSTLDSVRKHNQRWTLEHQHAQNRHSSGVDQHPHHGHHPSPRRMKEVQNSLRDGGQHKKKYWRVKSVP